MDKARKFVDLASEAKRMKIIWMPDLEYNAFDIRYSESEPPARISEDRLTYTGSKMWCSALTRGCVTSGNWYFECRINEPDQSWSEFKLRGWESDATVGNLLQSIPSLAESIKPSVRVGFGTRLSRFDGPIGSNVFGCSISQDGCRVMQDGKDITAPGDEVIDLKPGDIVGCAIKLGQTSTRLPDPRGIAALWPFVRKALLCDVTNPASLEAAKVLNVDSQLMFSVNGQWKKTVVTTLYCVEYHPGVSTFMGGSATLNMGPDFTYAPPDDSYKPASEMENSAYPCKEELLKFWILGDTSVLSEDAIISRDYYKVMPDTNA
ncbi:hypothetical protein X943_000304 [Babesia divergens]|uniref:SPRY domain-containing protein n=1 Tax=Babesia divergens TaxID=32595 RepID=A0AAD9LGG6_BABDI|nr:hypothetical protein X943_000304 [Babesia divergens]